MSRETLDLGEYADAAAVAARRKPCGGECGKMWDSAAGGWIYFDPPRWYCDECDERVNGSFVGTGKLEDYL